MSRADAAKILVVEDDRDIRESLVELLEDHGYRATGAAHGREALERLRESEPPSLILLDLMMPVMDARSFRDEQLRCPDLSKIPVVLISAYKDVEKRAADLGSLPFVRKPFELGELLRTVRSASNPAGPASDTAAGRRG